jgi:hypothetical protein
MQSACRSCALAAFEAVESRSVQFNDKLIAFAKHWGFRPRACAPCRARTKGKTIPREARSSQVQNFDADIAFAEI